MTHPKTWSETRGELPQGLSDSAIELVRTATAPARHKARVDATIEAALQAVCDVPDRATRRECRLAEVLCMIDARGQGGGIIGRGQSKTDRLAAFAGLGSGRRNACDGAAYMAALDDARRELGKAARTVILEIGHRVLEGAVSCISEQSAVAFLGRRLLWDESSLSAREYARIRLAEAGAYLSTCMVDTRPQAADELMAWDRCYGCLRLRASELPRWISQLCHEYCDDAFGSRPWNQILRTEMCRDMRALCEEARDVPVGGSTSDVMATWDDSDGTTVCLVVSGNDIVRVYPSHISCDRA